jgi:hypothetical protein
MLVDVVSNKRRHCCDQMELTLDISWLLLTLKTLCRREFFITGQLLHVLSNEED